MRKRTTTLSTALKTAGGVSAVARDLKISRQAVSKWDRCPLKHLGYFKRLGVSPEKLRPDAQ